MPGWSNWRRLPHVRASPARVIRHAETRIAEVRSAPKKLGIPAGPVLHDNKVYPDSRILARDMVAETNHPFTGPFSAMGVTVKRSATPGSIRRPTPRLTKHTGEILTERKAAE